MIIDKKGRFIRDANKDYYENYGIWYDPFGYPSIFVSGKNIQLHRYVWEKYNGEIPKGYYIHHIDGNKSNYNIENLSMETPSDHLKIHAGWIRNENKEWILKPCKHCKELLPLDKYYPRKGLTPLNICKKCSSEINKERLINDKEFRESKRLYLLEYYKRKKNGSND